MDSRIDKGAGPAHSDDAVFSSATSSVVGLNLGEGSDLWRVRVDLFSGDATPDWSLVWLALLTLSFREIPTTGMLIVMVLTKASV